MTTDLASWKGLGVETIDLPSGATVKVRRASIEALMIGGQLPDDLMRLALGAAQHGLSGDDLTEPELIRQAVRLKVGQLVASIVEPEVTEADWPLIPLEDQQALVAWLDVADKGMAAASDPDPPDVDAAAAVTDSEEEAGA